VISGLVRDWELVGKTGELPPGFFGYVTGRFQLRLNLRDLDGRLTITGLPNTTVGAVNCHPNRVESGLGCCRKVGSARGSREPGQV